MIGRQLVPEHKSPSGLLPCLLMECSGLIGLQVHRMLYVLTVLVELTDESLLMHQRQFLDFERDVRVSGGLVAIAERRMRCKA